MTTAQRIKCFAEFRKVCEARGLKGKAAEEFRDKLTLRACGVLKSWNDCTNRDVDELLSKFKAALNPGDFDGQMAQQDMPEKRIEGHILRIDILSRYMGLTLGSERGYIDGIARKMYGKQYHDLPERPLQQLEGVVRKRVRALHSDPHRSHLLPAHGGRPLAMDVFGQILDGRKAQNAEDRRRAAEAWQLAAGKPAEVRLLAFDRWVRIELSERLEWDWAAAQKERRIEQCRLRLEKVVLDLWRRGWMLDGKRLAARIVELLDAVGAYQRKGQVRDFWSYFSTAVERYVGANAEEIQAEAMRAGSHVGQLLGAYGIKAAAKEPALPELLAQRADEVTKAKGETLREKLARARARNAACNDDAAQPTLW